jgi:hypothetical protein
MPTRLAFDWDETVTDYPAAFAVLAAQFDEVYVITINHAVTPDEAKRLLGRHPDSIFHCPDMLVMDGTSQRWKADICKRLKIDLMLDDDPGVIEECQHSQIPAIGVLPAT